MIDLADRLSAALADRYRVERELGGGGMATVYLAEDLRHNRQVAVKVLREDLTRSVGASRFLREIEIAAHLQHPNILPLHDSGEADGLLYFVMPFVAGQSLRQRLDKDRELPVHEAIRILIEIVDALAYAHANGVVHRDIKPDNVMLSGRHALVTDFGVAKALSAATDDSSSTTPVTTLTSVGITVGTPAYMAPEQATADPHVDHRADLYAVGVLAYEMLTGLPPFTGTTAQQILAAHVTQNPEPLAKRKPGLPAALDEIIMKCLAKQPSDRWQSADELLARLETLPTPSTGTAPATPRAARSTLLRRTALATAAVATAVVIVVAVTMLTRSRPSTPTIGRQTQLTTDPGLELFPAISPDGKMVAYAAGTSARMRIFLRQASGGGGRTLPLSNDTAAVESEPRWSPNGERILFLSRGGVSVAPALGGPVREVVARSPTATVTAAAWSPDGKEIAFVRGDSLLIVGADGSGSRFLSRAKDWHSCAWTAKGNRLACVAGNPKYVEPGAFFANRNPSAIVVISATDGRITPVTDTTYSNNSPQWSADGSLLFFVSNRDGAYDIHSTPIGPTAASRPQPARISTGLGAHSFSFDSSGRRLTYAVYRETANLWSLPIPAPNQPRATNERVVALTSGTQIIEIVRINPDAKWLYYDSNVSGNTEIYRIRTTGGEPERLTNGVRDAYAATESPRGGEFSFHAQGTSGSRDIFVQSITGGPPGQLTSTPAQECCAVWSPDGNTLSFSEFPGGRISLLRRDSRGRWGAPVERLSRGFLHWWSPDGKWIAVATGRSIRGATSSERLELIPPDSGEATTLYTAVDTLTDPYVGDPQWARDGKGLYFKSHDVLGRASFWYLPVTGGRPRLLVRFDDLSRPSHRFNYTTDGRSFFFPINDRQGDVWVAEIGPRP